MLGYMEQTLEVAIRKAATAVGCFKPKFPFLTAKQSALLYMAYHLKGSFCSITEDVVQYCREKPLAL